MARLYSNENFPLPVVEELRRLGHDVQTIQESGKANQEYPDESVLALAAADNRAVLTINRKDFRKLHGESSEHKGIIICTVDLDFIGQAHRFMKPSNPSTIWIVSLFASIDHQDDPRNSVAHVRPALKLPDYPNHGP